MTPAALAAGPRPEPVTVTRWRCPFCHRSRAHKSTTAEHIARCWLNPAARSCKTCAHYELEPGGESCFPGRPCNCNDGYAECAAGVDIADYSIKNGCPLWALREETA